MRFVFLLPELQTDKRLARLERRVFNDRTDPLFRRLFGTDVYRMMTELEVPGGVLNIMRHCGIALHAGAEATLATRTGRNTYGSHAPRDLPYIPWSARKPDDVVILPDYFSRVFREVQGRAVVYEQMPAFVRNDFDYMNPRVSIWTDSPFMVDICERKLPGKAAEIVPNVIDGQKFPFVPQSERQPIVFAFPRKNPEFIDETERLYKADGGTHFRFERISGLSIHELAQAFRRPQVFLASAEMEGCALPPQESMASGLVVVGRTAKGANYAMEHEKTALVAETPAEAARCLKQAESFALRDAISRAAHTYISRFFADQEPLRFWQNNLQRFGASA